MTVYVGNLSYDATEEHLNEVFKEYGSVKRIQMPLDRETGRIRGFAFVEMSEESEEEAAIEDLDGAEWMGRTLKVNKARPRTERRPSNGGGGGGRGGWSGGGDRNRNFSKGY
ncbi:MAG: RNA-binding protein [Leptolyngbya sp. SIO1E4]|nr:RNA-binding protein [Leptolyngbya sp. SIO1E4]